ncbi:histone-lysine n- h3 lysine-79 specific [Malassezia pachydermatis]|uniref:Histone-lysine N-methyltransferase, H3 lysine-79 specific n=1 Tax=Malassezia pachydermatis TaxID=77020 RepID=A0A0M9VP81_9BASI|nr:histone-lysine n- h3 lysine-79 specific [Malassezia pachydermatis]KOS14139.1 histone-lysine n- h3 lysine-79 specific [Malassezia pachydermatis]
MQKRIAQDRLEAAQKKAALEAFARPRPRKVARTERPARRVMSHSRSVSDDDDDDADDAALDRLARSSASSSQYGTSTFHYHVPRSILPPDGYDPLAPELRATASGPISSRSLVETSETIYVPFFEGLEEQPVVTLEYPAIDAQEEFLLLVPKDVDEYDPISDLLRVVHAVVAHYIPAAQQPQFGHLDHLETGSNAGNTLDKVSARLAMRADSSGPSSRSTTPVPSTTSTPPPLSGPADETESILRSFTKARNRRNGPLFVRSVERYNALLRTLRQDGTITSHLATLGASHGMPEGVWRTIQEQVYARVAAPHVDKLKQYEAFSDYVYGEMLPPFLSEIERIAQMGPQSVFVDLGSGIGNILLQASLQTGCASYGCEVMETPSALATKQIIEATHRWRMWNVCGGPAMEAWCEDFTESDRVREVLRRADVVLVNNYAFRPKTNDTLSLLFLDLKDGAKIFSLRPFVPTDFRLTERTASSPLAILRVEERRYASGCVSWTGGSGAYYVQTVDRSLIQHFTASAVPENTTAM